MKAKLVKYPYDEKKYRWDTWYQGKEFEYFWDESLPNNFDTIEPFIKRKETLPTTKGYISLLNDPNENVYNDFSINNQNKKLKSYFYVQPNVDISSYVKNERKIRFTLGSGNGYTSSINDKVFPYATFTLDNENYELFSVVYYTYSYSGRNLTIRINQGRYFRNYIWINNTTNLYDISNDNSLRELCERIALDKNLTYDTLTCIKSNNHLDPYSDIEVQLIDTYVCSNYTSGNRPQWPATSGGINDFARSRADGISVNWNYTTNQVTGASKSAIYGQLEFPYTDDVYVIKDNLSSSFEFLNIITDIQTENQEPFKTSVRTSGTEYNDITYIEITSSNCRTEYNIPHSLFTSIYNTSTSEVDDYLIKHLISENKLISVSNSYQYTLINSSNKKLKTSLCLNDYSYNYKVVRNDNKIYIYNSNNTFIKSMNYFIKTPYVSNLYDGSNNHFLGYQYKPLHVSSIEESVRPKWPYNPITTDKCSITNELIPNSIAAWTEKVGINYIDRVAPFPIAHTNINGGINVKMVLNNYKKDNYNTTSSAANNNSGYISYNLTASSSYPYNPHDVSDIVNGTITYSNDEAKEVVDFHSQFWYPTYLFEEENGAVKGNFLKVSLSGSIPNNAYKMFVYSNQPSLSYTNTINKKYIGVDINEWMNVMGNTIFSYMRSTPKDVQYDSNVYSPIIKLLGDIETDNITILSGNTDIYEYNLGEGINSQFVPKTLQYNAPCEYENGAVSSNTWLTYNKYTVSEWANGFHFEGEQWNNIGSPFAYLNGITSSSGNRRMVYTFQEAEAGTYTNIFSLINGGFEVGDSLGNDYIDITDELEDYRHYYDDNVGSLWYFGSGTVSSTDRHAYPDDGSQNNYTYLLRPQDTTFLRYYRVRDELENVELFNDRYKYTHDTVDFCDRSYEGTVCGTSQSTGEDNIPDGTWREYMGLYLGESIPFLGITEAHIPPAEILGVPVYDKQVNTSDTLKYGTVAAASLSFTLNKPVGECMELNNQLLVLFYDFKHIDNYERLGFFRIDTIEAIDENTTSMVAHDETYKLNKYVDDFLEDYTQATTLDHFYRDLLDYCGCFYDTQQPLIHNGSLALNNVYHAVKTTGVQVAHYIAILVPGFVHADIDGDIVMSQYELKDDTLTKTDYSNLVYTAYKTDMLNKLKITSNNAVKGESNGDGINTYYLADDPLLSEMQTTTYYNNLANSIMAFYNAIPTYRPATVDFLILPRGLKIGDIVRLTTPKEETYKIIVMKMNISSSGVNIQSFGTQTYPVEAESSSEFVNLINDMGEISGDVSNIIEAQQTMATAIGNNTTAIEANTLQIEALSSAIGTESTGLTNLSNQVNGFGVSVANNLATIVLNGTTNNIATKEYADTVSAAALRVAENYTDTKVANALIVEKGTITYQKTAAGTTYSEDVMYIGNKTHTYGIMVPFTDTSQDDMYKVCNGYFYYYNGTAWHTTVSSTYTPY